MKNAEIKLMKYGLREKIRIKERAIKTQTEVLDEYRKAIREKDALIRDLVKQLRLISEELKRQNITLNIK